MPLVRIDLAEGQSADYRSAVADEVYKAMTTTMNVPIDDRFMLINEHKPGNFSPIRIISASSGRLSASSCNSR